MSFNLVGSIGLQVYTDSSQTNNPQLLMPSITQSWTSSTVTGVQTETVSLAALGAVTVNLNGLTSVKGLFIYSDTTNVSVNINSVGNITCNASIPGFIPFTVTSLVITNASATTATNVTYSLISST